MKSFKQYFLENLLGTVRPDFSGGLANTKEKYYLNPTISEVNTVYASAKSVGSREYIRGIAMSDGDLYIWAGQYVNHSSAVGSILDSEDIDAIFNTISDGRAIAEGLPILVSIDTKYVIWCADGYFKKITEASSDYIEEVFNAVKKKNKWIQGIKLSPIKL